MCNKLSIGDPEDYAAIATSRRYTASRVPATASWGENFWGNAQIGLDKKRYPRKFRILNPHGNKTNSWIEYTL